MSTFPALMRMALVCALCWILPVGAAQGAGAFQQLDISLVELDPGIPEDSTQYRANYIFPDVRRAESRYLPYVLRQTLVLSDDWGVVRVLFEPDPAAELLITGSIVRSDGIALEIALRAVDATGREWLNKTYQATTTERDFSRDRDRSRPLFAALYEQVQADLLARATELGAGEIERIGQVSQLRYAQGLMPEAFSAYLARDAAGLWTLQRLPALDDPLLERIERVRQHEFLYIDTIDEQYAALFDRMTPGYDLWRKFVREQVLYDDTHLEYLRSRDKRHNDQFESMRQTYGAYKWWKIEQQEAATLARGFNNELSPTSLELEGRLVELKGNLKESYAEWRRILYQMFRQETGLDPAAGNPPAVR